MFSFWLIGIFAQPTVTDGLNAFDISPASLSQSSRACKDRKDWISGKDMKGGKMPEKRLNCRIPLVADAELDRIIARRTSKKGKTIAYLMDRARDEPNHPVRAFEGNDAQTCTYNAPDKWLATFQPYREQYGLYENTAFFRHALLRGMSIVMDEYGRNGGNGAPSN